MARPIERVDIPGKPYNEVVLECMMYYPTIFPSEAAVCDHMFNCFGTGYEWNKRGQLVYDSRGRKKEKLERTQKSILRGHTIFDKFLVFHPCGNNLPYFYTSICKEYSPIWHVADGRVTPDEDWFSNICRYCRLILSYNGRKFEAYLRAYYDLVDIRFKDRAIINYRQLRKLAKMVVERYREYSKNEKV